MIHGVLQRECISRSVLWLLLIVALAAPAAAQAPRPPSEAQMSGGAPAPAPADIPLTPQPAGFACPMHPDIRSKVPGTCPVCGMALVSSDPEAGAYDLDVTTSPAPVVAGRPFQLHLTVRDPKARAVVKQDLEHYDHVHPEQRPDGSWSLEVTVPKPGKCKIYSDFLPRGGSPQVIARTLVTDGAAADRAASGTKLTPDRDLSHIAGSMTVTLDLPESGLVAGREETSGTTSRTPPPARPSPTSNRTSGHGGIRF